MQLISKNYKYKQVKRFDKGKPIKVDQQQDPRLLNPSESTRINSPYIKEKALKPTQKVDPDRMGIEEFIPFIGDASDVVNVGNDINAGNYGQAALSAGLLLLPNFLEKPLKAVGKAIERGVLKGVDNITPLRRFYFKQQDKKMVEGIHEVMKAHNGSETLSNLDVYDNLITPKLNSDIIHRARKAGSDFGNNISTQNPYENLGTFILDNKQQDPLYLKKSKMLSSDKNLANQAKESLLEFMKNPYSSGMNRELAGNTNIIALKRYDQNGNLFPLKRIKGTAAHEAGHMMNNVYGFNFSKETIEGFRPNTNTKLGEMLEPLLGSKLKGLEQWAKSPNELHADLWKFRTLNRIGSRDLTEKEIDRFIKEYGSKHFISDNLNKIKEVVKLIPALGGIYMINRANDKNEQ